MDYAQRLDAEEMNGSVRNARAFILMLPAPRAP